VSTSLTGAFVTQATNALFQFHFNSCALTESVCIYTDVNQFASSKHNCKVACLQMPYPVDPNFDTLVQDLEKHCDHILILMSELHARTLEFVERNDKDKLVYFICGELNYKVKNCTVHKFFDWFTTTVHFYKYVKPDTLSVLQPYATKPKYFDALLGRKKYHRDVAYSRIDKDQNIVTYLGDTSCNFSNPNLWIWESDGLIIDKKIEWTVDRVPYHGHRMSISQIIPLTVYNQTAYTIVAETNFDNHYSFYTEKTVKPIVAKRLFVMYGGQYQLKNLRALGFKTFDSVIDESYDNIPDYYERFDAVSNQVNFLQSQPQEEILDKIKPICEHNYNVMMSTDWYGDYFKSEFVKYFNQ